MRNVFLCLTADEHGLGISCFLYKPQMNTDEHRLVIYLTTDEHGLGFVMNLTTEAV